MDAAGDTKGSPPRALWSQGDAVQPATHPRHGRRVPAREREGRLDRRRPLYEEANRLVTRQALDSRQVSEGGEGTDQATSPVMPEASRLVVRIRSSGKPTLLS